MLAIASRAAWHGPSGFSFESITTAPGGAGRRRVAAASMGSDMIRNAPAAEAAAVRCRNERREKPGIGGLQWKGVYQTWKRLGPEHSELVTFSSCRITAKLKGDET